MAQLITGNCHLKRHLLKLGLVDSPGCGRYLKRPHMFFGTVKHWWHKIFRHLSRHFFKPGHVNIYVSKVLQFT